MLETLDPVVTIVALIAVGFLGAFLCMLWRDRIAFRRAAWEEITKLFHSHMDAANLLVDDPGTPSEVKRFVFHYAQFVAEPYIASHLARSLANRDRSKPRASDPVADLLINDLRELRNTRNDLFEAFLEFLYNGIYAGALRDNIAGTWTFKLIRLASEIRSTKELEATSALIATVRKASKGNSLQPV